MKKAAQVVIAVVFYFVLHMALVCLFPSYSEDAAEYERIQRELEEDRETLKAYREEK